MHTVFALLCFVVVIHWLIFPYPSGLLHWHCGNLTIAPVPAKQPWWIWINTSCEFIMNDCITTTKQSTTKPCAYFLGYTLLIHVLRGFFTGTGTVAIARLARCQWRNLQGCEWNRRVHISCYILWSNGVDSLLLWCMVYASPCCSFIIYSRAPTMYCIEGFNLHFANVWQARFIIYRWHSKLIQINAYWACVEQQFVRRYYIVTRLLTEMYSVCLLSQVLWFVHRKLA